MEELHHVVSGNGQQIHRRAIDSISSHCWRRVTLCHSFSTHQNCLGWADGSSRVFANSVVAQEQSRVLRVLIETRKLERPLEKHVDMGPARRHRYAGLRNIRLSAISVLMGCSCRLAPSCSESSARVPVVQCAGRSSHSSLASIRLQLWAGGDCVGQPTGGSDRERERERERWRERGILGAQERQIDRALDRALTEKGSRGTCGKI